MDLGLKQKNVVKHFSRVRKDKLELIQYLSRVVHNLRLIFTCDVI